MEPIPRDVGKKHLRGQIGRNAGTASPSKQMIRELFTMPADLHSRLQSLEQMLDDGGFVPAHVAERFSRGRIFGIGSTMRQFLRSYKSGLPWEQCGVPSAGNGALMRIAPILIPHLRTRTADLWADAALCAMLTHNDTVAAIVGAAVGALHGRAGLPSRWIDSLLGRTTDSDDGRVVELLEAARVKWWGTA